MCKFTPQNTHSSHRTSRVWFIFTAISVLLNGPVTVATSSGGFPSELSKSEKQRVFACRITANIKHSNLQLPRDSSEVDSERKGLREMTDKSPEVHSSYHKLCVVMVVLDSLRSTLMCSGVARLGHVP